MADHAKAKRLAKEHLKCNKPTRTPNHPTKSHIVKACGEGVPGGEKIIRFGEQGASTAGKPKEGESERMKQKRASFKARHAKNIAKGKSSAAYWSAHTKWLLVGAMLSGIYELSDAFNFGAQNFLC